MTSEEGQEPQGKTNRVPDGVVDGNNPWKSRRLRRRSRNSGGPWMELVADEQRAWRSEERRVGKECRN